ncbi:helix-turn-helix domain-containing protein [archaeon]|nr:helix-turn-helix domain-containing protein [archaeon]MBL7057627.1 helix-turn-helix domain-containing protein [Candidatus Woesearchaeota archaeon]
MYEILEDIGLSKNESKAYLALLETGLTTVGKIAKKAKIERTNMYDSLERLKNKGLVSFISSENSTYYKASEPSYLENLLQEKERRLKEIMPRLELLKKLNEQQNKTEVHEGLKAFTNLLGNFLLYNQPIFVYGIPRIAPEKMKFFIPHFHKMRIEKGIVMKHIYNFDARDRIKYLNGLEFTEAKHLSHDFDSLVTTCICGDEVLMTDWEREPLTTRLMNPSLAATYKKYFELLWKSSNI